MNSRKKSWWDSPILWIALAIVSAAPFLAVDLPPLTDLPNHFARYYIFLHIDQSPFLMRYYDVHWSLKGNLGVDLLVRAFSPALGLETAVRIAIGTIPPLTVAGIYSVSRSVGGQVAPGAFLALPLIYNWPFISGFVNFSLSGALALLVFALWIRLRMWPFILRLVVFAPLALATWIAHVAGWGLLGLAVGGFEIQRAIRARGLTPLVLLDVALEVSPFATVMCFVFIWRSGIADPIGMYFPPDVVRSKLVSLLTILREQYQYWDIVSSFLLLGLAVATFFSCGATFIAPVTIVACFFFFAFLLCPDGLFGGSFADRRLLPYAAILAVLSIGVSDRLVADRRRRKLASVVSFLAVVLFIARIAVTTSVWRDVATTQNVHLALLNEVPERSRIFSLFVEPCEKNWPRGRLDHMQQLAIPLRKSITNGQFQEGNLNQVKVLFRKQNGFDPNMGAAIHSSECQVSSSVSFQSAISLFPRAEFDFLWLVSEAELPSFDTSGLLLVGSVAHDRLYRIPVPAIDQTTPSWR
jgi:hypothetical protein